VELHQEVGVRREVSVDGDRQGGPGTRRSLRSAVDVRPRQRQRAAINRDLAFLQVAHHHAVEGKPVEMRRQAESVDDVEGPVPAAHEPGQGCSGLRPDGGADLIAVARAFIANPDLVARLQLDAPLDPADESSFYGGTDAGYIGYPALEADAA
jgi:N-ethylmaleimide reductase